MGSKQERRLNALGSAWLFVNPAGCMEEAFSIHGRSIHQDTENHTIREVAVSTPEL